ncbi:hypothetical protein [Amycolatopsis sp. lyj-84]|uniref:hypothetical protein n=1 Tax=Amycolatopsis sp. lyj-84 TaxID=2789284 RepID=UPI003978823A
MAEAVVRPMEVILVAAGSPTGRAAEAINDLTRHLPDPGEPDFCPTCAGRFWPCAVFDDAASRVHAARLRVGDVVPLDLHPRLWPSSAQPVSPVWPSGPAFE